MFFYLLTAFSVGLLGSFHCIGMCGPIALALPIQDQSSSKRFWSSVIYNLGRICTYALLGVGLGLIGNVLILIGLQQWLSIILGICILLGVLFPHKTQQITKQNRLIAPVLVKVKKQMAKLLAWQSWKAFFTIGLLNGLLPCGLVYIAVLGAIATANVFYSAVYMALFGLGTMPMMLIATQFRNALSFNLRMKLRKATPFFIVIMGVLFIVRGMNLGIPYLSPKVTHPTSIQQESMQEAIIPICH